MHRRACIAGKILKLFNDSGVIIPARRKNLFTKVYQLVAQFTGNGFSVEFIRTKRVKAINFWAAFFSILNIFNNVA